jgi:hypothetical protein
MNRIESGTEEALRIESYDQAATAVAAFYAGLPFPPLSLTKQRAEGRRYRDDMMMAVYSVGSAAQHVLQNYEHPMDQLAAETGAHNVGGEFVTKHWREIEAVAKALFERRDVSVEEVTKLLK